MSRTTTHERCRELVEGLVGRRTGIISEVSEAEPIEGDAHLHYFGARLSRTHPGFSEFGPQFTGGSGTTRSSALIAALCEGVERYAAGVYPPSSDRLVPRDKLAIPSLDPAGCAAFSDKQRRVHGFPYVRPEPDVPIRWVVGKDLLSGEPCAVPAFTVYLPYLPTNGEPLLGPGISTGLCCAETAEEALVGGICEVIERDASALLWLKGISPPRIDAERVAECAGDILPPDDEAASYDITTDVGFPTVFLVCQGMGPFGQLISVGSACHLNADAALRKAAKEASQDRVYVRLLIEDDPEWTPGPDFVNVVDFRFHARLYSGRPDLAAQAFSCLHRCPTVSSFMTDHAEDTADACLQRLVEALAADELSGAWVDLTPEWAARLGLCVVKVVIPGLLPLHGNHHLAYLGHPRLAAAARAMPSGRIEHDHPIWPYPHPSP